MSLRTRRTISLVILALFVCVVGLANVAFAGKGGGNSTAEEQQLFYFLQVNAQRNRTSSGNPNQ